MKEEPYLKLVPVGDYNGHNEGLKINKHLKQMYTKILMVTLKAGLHIIFFVLFYFFFFFDMSCLYNKKKEDGI